MPFPPQQLGPTALLCPQRVSTSGLGEHSLPSYGPGISVRGLGGQEVAPREAGFSRGERKEEGHKEGDGLGVGGWRCWEHRGGGKGRGGPARMGSGELCGGGSGKAGTGGGSCRGRGGEG